MIDRGELDEQDKLLRLTGVKRSGSTRLWTAVLVTHGWLSHLSAARLIAGDRLLPEAVHVTVRRGMATRSPEWVRVHSSRRLPRQHTTTHESGLPHTVLPRTFVDLAASAVFSDQQLVDFIDAWMTQSGLSLRWIAWFLEHEAESLPGRRRALGILHSLGGGTVDSGGERIAQRLFAAAGIPPPVLHHPFAVGGRIVAEIDFAWPAHRVALEIDSYKFHSGPRVFVADRRKGNKIELERWTLLRIPAADLRDEPEQVVATVRRALEVSGAVLGPRVGEPRPPHG